MTRPLLFALFLLACFAAQARAAELQLTIQDGKVTLDARDVTLGQILTEWARVGKTRMVNVERLGGGPLTMKFDAIPEKQALDILLRAIPGYMAAPRETFMADASLYETILVMPTTTAVAAVRTPQRPGSPAGAPFGTPASITQLRQALPRAPAPADAQEPPDADDDPAIAAAAAAGLLPGPPPAPGTVATPIAPTSLPGQTQPAAAPTAPGTTTPAPTNPWNAPAGTAQPSLPTPPPAVTQPVVRPRPQAADR